MSRQLSAISGQLPVERPGSRPKTERHYDEHRYPAMAAAISKWLTADG